MPFFKKHNRFFCLFLISLYPSSFRGNVYRCEVTMRDKVVNVQMGNMKRGGLRLFICISLQTNPTIDWSGKSSLPMNILFWKGFQMFILSFRDGWVTVQLGIHIRKSADSHANVLILNNFYTKFYVGVDVISYALDSGSFLWISGYWWSMILARRRSGSEGHSFKTCAGKDSSLWNLC